MSERVNQINEALARPIFAPPLGYISEDKYREIRRLRELERAAARDYVDLLSRLADGSLVETMAEAVAKAAIGSNEWEGLVSDTYRVSARAALAALGLQEDD